MIPVWALRYIVPVVAGIALLWAGNRWLNSIEERGYERGKGEIQAKWDRANREAQDEQDRARKAREADAVRAAKEVESANRSAREWEAKWRAERGKVRGPLVSVACPTPAEGAQGAASGERRDDRGAVDRDGPVVRFAAEFVRRYDGIWTGATGQPVFQYPAGVVEASIAASPVGPDDLLDTHGENASRCSENSRQLGKLIDLIERLRAQ